MSTEEATINEDGSQTFETPPGGETGGDENFNGTEGEDFMGDGEKMGDDVGPKGIDPAIYLALFVLVVGAIYIYYKFRADQTDDSDTFFTELDGDKFNIKLPDAVEEYYTTKEKAIKAGFEPNQPPPTDRNDPSNAGRTMLAQALMKRCIADIPIVTFIQKESNGMNKLYSQSMCSIKQWKAYQKAENLVSTEVDECRAEADLIEPGWSNHIWKQAVQYHNMLKNKHETEAKAAADQAKKIKAEQEKRAAVQKAVDDAKAKELAAEKAAQELIKAEEREKASKKSFKAGDSSTMKKGFLDTTKK